MTTTKEKMETRHCPYCDCKDLNYTIDIFKKSTDKEYYTGDVNCSNCKKYFKIENIKIKEWVSKTKIKILITKLWKHPKKFEGNKSKTCLALDYVEELINEVLE